MEYVDPDKTIRILNQLEQRGFDNSAFETLHHFWQRADDHPERYATIDRHREYCKRTRRFLPDGNNARLQRRLELVLSWHQQCGKSFIQLAQDAVREVPFLPLRTAGSGRWRK